MRLQASVCQMLRICKVCQMLHLVQRIEFETGFQVLNVFPGRNEFPPWYLENFAGVSQLFKYCVSPYLNTLLQLIVKQSMYNECYIFCNSQRSSSSGAMTVCVGCHASPQICSSIFSISSVCDFLLCHGVTPLIIFCIS